MEARRHHRKNLNLRPIWNPDMYHGHSKKPDFFEGWYFKLINASGDRRYAVIPGIFLHQDPTESHAFVQTLDGVTGGSTYHRYPLSEFWASDEKFEVRIGPNHFQADRISLDIDSTERRMKGKLHFKGLSAWPVTRFSPGVMGWYAFMPFMECYHGIVSLDHHIEGGLTVDGVTTDFTGGHGYIEKDWGQSFPRGYVWMQTNHFEQSGTCFMGSVAMIPWMFTEFRGFLVGFWHEGVLYRFTTYTGAKIDNLGLTDTHVHWNVTGKAGEGAQKGKFRLELEAERAKGGLLHAPYRTGMVQRIVESLTATVNVRLIRLDGGEKIVFEGTGRYAGLEVAGELDKIFDIDKSTPKA